jgi:hypothetical protein
MGSRGAKFWIPIIIGIAGLVFAIVLVVHFPAQPVNRRVTVECARSVTPALCTKCCLAHGAGAIQFSGTGCECVGEK